MKKIFIISSILLVVVLVFFGIYTIAFKPQSTVKTPIVAVDDEDYAVDIEGIVGEKLTNITSESVIAPVIGPDGKTIRYFSGVDGRVYTMTLRGSNKETLLDSVDGVPESVKWASSSDAAAVVYDDGIYTIQISADTQVKLRDGMDDIVWAGNTGKILYKYYDQATGERTLNISNADGTGWKKLADLPYRYTTFTQIPSSILASFWPSSDAETTSALFTINTVNGGEPKQISGGGKGVEYLYAPNGKNILVSKIGPDGMYVLGVMNSDGQDYVDLLIPTPVKKAVWSKDGKTVYYAQPLDIPDGVTLPNDYDTKTFTTQDTFFKVDIETGKKERIIELEDITEQVDAVDLFLSPAEDALFFVNRKNGLLYRVDL